MVSYKAVEFDASDTDYIRCMGWEQDSDAAHWGPGFRPYFILHYVLSGSGVVNGQVIHENQGFFLNNRDLHEYHSSPEDPWKYFWVIFSEDLAKKYVIPKLVPGESTVFGFDYRDRILKLCNEIFAQPEAMSHIKALSYFFTLLSFHEETRFRDSSAGRRYVELAKLYIENHCHAGISVRAVADALFINDRYLYNLFVQLEGVSVKRYIIDRIIASACELLKGTELPVSEISAAVGFPDVCTFSRYFSKHAGVSPTKYREAISARINSPAKFNELYR